MAQPCNDWPLNAGCTYGIPVDPLLRTPTQAYAVSRATEILWRLTAGVYGLCPLTVRPCGRKCVGFDYWPTQTANGSWVNVACGCESAQCGCCYVDGIALDGPVASVDVVLIDGVVVAPGTYRVDNGYLLTRVGAATAWPKCQDLSLPDTEVGTFSVTYQRGSDVPLGGQGAVAALAAEIVKSCTGAACRLPSRVQQFTRQGITVDIMNDVEFLRSGLTGIPEVDQWVSSVNPHNQRSQSSIYSPDDITLRYVG